MFVPSRWQKEVESIQQKIKKLDDNLFEGKKYKVRYIAGIKNSKGTTNFEGRLHNWRIQDKGGRINKTFT